MSESPEPRRSRWPAGLVAALVLGFLVERGIDRRGHDFLSSLQWDWQGARESASRSQDAQIICLGDSLLKEGVLPAIIEARLGTKAMSLAVNAGHPSAHRALFETATGRGARPSIVVVESEPWLMSSGFRYNHANWPVLLDLAKATRLATSMRDASFLAWWAAAQIPSVRSREEVRRLTLSTLRDEPPMQRFGNAALVRNWRANQGAQVFDEWSKFDGRLTPDHHQWFPIEIRLDDASRADLDPMMDELSSEGRRVYWLLPPISRAAKERRSAEGFTARQDLLVAALMSRHPSIVVLDSRRLELGDDCFHDPFHLNLRGATELSNRLATALATPTPLSRRIDLARVATIRPSATPRIETMADSQAILHNRRQR
jgi:hypothetical protein